jgi:aminopeptidase N
MENASAIFYAENSVTGNQSSEALVAHEIAHQWFGNMASEKTFAHLWLSEGFATYLTDIYLEQKYGKDTLQKRLQEERQEVLDFSRQWNGPVVDSVSALLDLLNANSYQKGAWVLHMLRRRLGDTVFQKVIQTYYAQYKGGNADTNDFQKVAERVSGKSVDVFFRQWLFTPGVPRLQVQWWEEQGQLVLTVKQQQAQPFQFPLQIGICGQGGAMTTEKVRITRGEETFRLKGYTNIRQVVLDPEVALLFEGAVTKGK